MYLGHQYSYQPLQKGRQQKKMTNIGFSALTLFLDVAISVVVVVVNPFDVINLKTGDRFYKP